MRISCDSCGAVFETKDNIVCPACGASYANDDELNAVQQYEQKKREYELEQQKEKIESQKIRNKYLNMQAEDQAKKYQSAERIRKFSEKTNKGCGTVLLAAGILFFLCIAIGIKMGIDEEFGDRSGKIETTTEEITTEVDGVLAEGNFGEDLDTGRCIFKIDKIQKTSAYPWMASVDHSCVLIHALLTNKMQYHWLKTDESYSIVADGIAQRSFYLPTGYKSFASGIDVGLTGEGWFKFEIPDNAKEMEFRFGDHIICHFTWDDVTEE